MKLNIKEKLNIDSEVARINNSPALALGKTLFSVRQDIAELSSDNVFPLDQMPYQSNSLATFTANGMEYAYVRSTLATALLTGIPYLNREDEQNSSRDIIRFGSTVTCVRPEDLAKPAVPGIRNGVFAQSDLELASLLGPNDDEEYINLNSQVLIDSVRWLVRLGLPPSNIQVRINNFTEILFNILRCDKDSLDPKTQNLAWDIMNELDRASFEENYDLLRDLRKQAEQIISSLSLDSNQRNILSSWVNEGNYEPSQLTQFPVASNALAIIKEIEKTIERALPGISVKTSPRSYRISPFAYSRATSQIDAKGRRGRKVAEIAGGGDYTATARRFANNNNFPNAGKYTLTGIAFGLMRVNTVLGK